MGVVLYHIWAGGKHDEFTHDFDEAKQIFERLAAEYHDSGYEVHWHVEEYDSEADFEADHLADEQCLMTTVPEAA
jgi:hypothetical protein